MKKTDKRLIVVIIALLLYVCGFVMADRAQTDNGYVKVERIDIVTNSGLKLSAKIYIPKNATAKTPAPGILALPGGNACLENLSSITIELSRRGYVVMAIDPYTIGRSDESKVSDVGARDAMDYLTSLAFVDSNKLGAIGHSAGAGRALSAVTTDDDKTVLRDGVKAIMYLGAGNFNLEGVDMAVFIGTWDNTYGQGKIRARDIATNEAYASNLGVDVIELNHTYTMPDGSHRTLYQGNSGHPTALVLPEPMRDMVEFFDASLAKATRPCDNLIYGWKELGTSLGIVGCLMMMFPIISWLLETKFFSSIIRPIPAPVSGVNAPFIFYLVLPALINTLICKWAIFNGQTLLAKINWLLRINNTNGFVFWFGCSALLSIVILAIRFKWDGKIDKERILTHAKTTWPNFFKALLLGFIAVSVVYALTYLADVLWSLSPRVWKVQLNVLATPIRWQMFVTYFPLYLLFFGVFNFSQTIGLRIEGQSEAAFTRLVWLTSTIPAGLFLLYAYSKLWFTGYTAITNVQMSRANSTLLNCILTYFISCKVTTYCYQKTGSYHTGAVINAIIMTWTAVATDLILAL
ncbi:MAG: hypothetical protein IKS54_04945 [Erysipelotrichaceae bacterium]|nr:hypothetical protein [Erysipelotrichaceae bacterium]